MDFQKAGILLEKINTLYKNLSDDEGGSISEIEKDLMRAYLRQFYEYFMSHEQVKAREEDPISIEPPMERKEKKKPEPPKPPVREPKVVPPPLVYTEDDDEEDDAPPPAPRIIPVPVDIPKPTRAREKSREPEMEEDLETLFEHHQAKELSEKLSESPIQDLNKAMGLNEKIFTVNELFDGDQEAFKQAVQVLNGLSSFEEAKNYLVREAAFRYNWAHPQKKNKAKNFIKLVRRRYNS